MCHEYNININEIKKKIIGLGISIIKKKLDFQIILKKSKSTKEKDS